ncbi:MAG: AAA family ATPase [Acidimicrobiia bacterium]|nr:AAA family ATPase [Acidimicrobiia bacterium]
MGYVVEFCGLPGSGKSTLARHVVAELRLRGVPTTDVMAPLGPDARRADRIRRKASAVAAGLLEPGAARLVNGVAFHSDQTDRRDQLARPANLLVVRHVLRRARRRRGVAVLDQGPLQEWWSAALRADADRVLDLARRDPGEAPDLLVRVDTPILVLVDRLEGRGARQSRLEDGDGATRTAELERGNTLLDALFDQLVYSPGVTPAILRVGGLDQRGVSEVVAAVIEASGSGGVQ